MRSAALALLLGLAPGPSPAEELIQGDGIRGQAADPEEEAAIVRVQAGLRDDPGAAEELARRVFKSKLYARFAGREPEEKLAAIREWIASDLRSAAEIAVGLARDDASGTHEFEDLLSFQASQTREYNPDSKKGLLGRLKKSSKDSKLMKKDEEMQDEEKSEIIKTLFEGQGGMAGQVLTQTKGSPGDKGSVGGGARFSDSSFYARLGQGNLTGYSPQLLAIQSALNARRAPGAPKLIETGKLDYPTLSYPAFGMRFDLKTLGSRLTYERNFALARLAGATLTEEELRDEKTTERLKARLKGGKAPSPRFERRSRALLRAQEILSDFENAALESRDPSRITRALLAGLGARQKDAARWITIAGLEEELMRIEAEEGFWSAELEAAIAAAPLAPDARAAYLRRGKDFRGRLQKLRANAESAIASLESSDWQKAVAGVEALMGESARLRGNLSRDIRNFVNTPFRLREGAGAKPRWRALLEDLVRRWLPGTSYGKELVAAERRIALLKDVFLKIAAGDLEAAHRILGSFEPARVPRA